MKLTITREDFLELLLRVSGVVEKRQTMPIISHIYLELSTSEGAQQNLLTVIGTDLEVELMGQKAMPANPTDQPGSITLPGQKLVEICKALPKDSLVVLQQEKNKIVLSSGAVRFSLLTLPAHEFPRVHLEDSQPVEVTVTEGDLQYLICRTHFAMAQQDVRYFLNGMLLEIANSGEIRAVATDGHRLSFNSLPISFTHVPNTPITQLIIPRKGIVELMRLIGNVPENPITLQLSPHHIRIINGKTILTSKLIDGQFPSYSRILTNAQQGDKSFLLDRDQLKEVVSRIAILANEKIRGILLQLQPNLLKISAHNAEQELAEEEFPIVYDNGNVDIAINVNYLLQILNAIEPGQIRLTLSNATGGLLVEETRPGNSLFVIMSMRL